MPSSRTGHKARSVRATSSLEGRGDEWLGLGALPYCDTLNSKCSACILQHVGGALFGHLSEAGLQ